ncbi:class I SAM-dependent methyltransferase [Candidatus Bathyarchaeota archaeon]|nr:MAG: class I SAM-dependent methyltransferase [Candidatus Bathyarchaeota archaeon]TMI29898.1 MAG: class I SAM-dependent methyltransferase [Candidatus Bathyarchaeota archaeon]
MGLLEAWGDSDFYHIHSKATRESREIYPLSLHRFSGNSVEEYYDKLSTGYDELYGPEQSRKHTKVIDFLGDKIVEIVVDVGCGTGNLLERVGKRSEMGVGIDISLRMLFKARARLGRGRAELIRADSKALPIKSASADIVLAISLLEFSKGDWRSRIMELGRIVKRRGTLAFTVFHPDRQVLKIGRLGLRPGTRVENVSGMETLYLVSDKQ